MILNIFYSLWLNKSKHFSTLVHFFALSVLLLKDVSDATSALPFVIVMAFHSRSY